VLEIAQRLIAGDIGLIAGCRQLSSLSHEVVDDWGADPDFVLFGAVDSETDHLPLEDQRAHWDPAAFEEKQHEVRRYEAETREQVLRACRSVISRFGSA
jgi:hypothetical protein